MANLTINQLEAEIRYHNKKYFQENAPEISDVEFDKLVNQLKKKWPDSQVLLEIADSQWYNTFEPVSRGTPMLSLDKCYNDEALLAWAESFDTFIAMPKIDGCALELYYNNAGELFCAATRGDGYTGENVTLNAFQIETIPQKIEHPFNGNGTIIVRGEVYMPLSVFEEFKDNFANPRNLAAGALRQKFASETKKYKLAFLAYDLGGDVQHRDESLKFACLEEMGFQHVRPLLGLKQEHLVKIHETSVRSRQEFDYEIDGMVYKASKFEQQQSAGFTSHHPRYAIAYKFDSEEKSTKIVDVKWQVARTGKITPVAIIEPVSLSGATVTNITLHNAARLIELSLGFGDIVLVTRRGGVIPHIERVQSYNDSNRFSFPEVCPGCGGKVVKNAVSIDCASPRQCVSAKLAGLEHFVKTISCDGFGPSIIQKLYDAGVLYQPADFYALSIESLLSAGIGEKLSAKLHGNISAKTVLPIHTFLTAFGIESLGEQTAKAIAAKFLTLEKVFDEVLSDTPEAIFEIDGISDKTYANIRDGVLAKSNEIDAVLEFVTVPNLEKNTEGKLSGKTFLFTGKLTMPRGKMEKCVTDLGGEISGSVNEKLTYLVVGDDAGSKLEKALTLIAKGAKLQILSEVQFNSLLG